MDDLFDYDIENVELDINIPDPEPLPNSIPSTTQSKGSKKKDGLGLENEVEVKKKRITVKLDEQRLLSSKGLPRLRKEAPKQLKFKGKGHEYKDAARLLSYYQLWADDLFKKAKFRDTLEIIEKLGHSGSMRKQREEWIDESRQSKRDAEDMRDLHARKDGEEGPSGGNRDGKSNDDELYSLPTGRSAPRQPNAPSSKDTATPEDPNALFFGGAPDDSDEDMDNFNDEEFEALLAAEREKADKSNESGKAPAQPEPEQDEFEDDLEAMEAMESLEAMAAMGNPGGNGTSNAPLRAPPPAPPEDDFEEDMEAMAAMEVMAATEAMEAMETAS
ncbi:Swi3-domain-containing protein [Wilcoxina mikolae CBS 423.85]|nr:Swi3-domain-containing protein [Wilcoxina mikolae CBS 423.85]